MNGPVIDGSRMIMKNERQKENRGTNERSPVVGSVPAISVSILILAVLLIFP
jgi:hypothetical protein